MQLFEVGLIEVRGTNQVDHVRKVGRAPSCKFHLDQRFQVNVIQILDHLANVQGIRKGYWTWSAAPGKKSGQKTVQRDAVSPVNEPAGSTGRLLVVLGNVLLLELSKALRREKYIHVS